MTFGYNDLVWIISVIAWTIGVTMITLYYKKKKKNRKEAKLITWRQTIHFAFSFVSHIPKALFSVSRQIAK
jgi:hypothetical protein